MSSVNPGSSHPGRQSPDPERQSDAQVGQGSSAKTSDAAHNSDASKQSSKHTKENVLQSNPKGPLEDEAAAKLK